MDRAPACSIVTTLARKRSEKFPDVPTVFEAAKLSPAAERLLDWRAGIAGLGRVILVTPGTPQDRVDLLRKALARILRDPAYIAEMQEGQSGGRLCRRRRCAGRRSSRR